METVMEMEKVNQVSQATQEHQVVLTLVSQIGPLHGHPIVFLVSLTLWQLPMQ